MNRRARAAERAVIGHRSGLAAHGYQEQRLGRAVGPDMINVSRAVVCSNSINAASMRLKRPGWSPPEQICACRERDIS